MDPVYFFSWEKSTYNTYKERAVFCQWYIQPFMGKKAIYDISDGIPNRYIINKKFICRETWMMANKALLFAKGQHKKQNMDIYHMIMQSKSPKEIRSLGRKVLGFDIKIWKKYRYKVVTNGNYLQFTQNEKFKKILLATGDRPMAEASPYDKIWGLGYSEAQIKKKGITFKDWKNLGLNLLGRSLMETRKKIREELA